MGDQNMTEMTAEDKRGMFTRTESMAQHSGRLIEMLDQIEKRVEVLREQASALELEKSSMLEALHTLQNSKDLQYCSPGEREEIQITAERLVCRCLTVDVCVNTVRNQQQEDALQRVNTVLDEISEKIRDDMRSSYDTLLLYYNACCPDTTGPIDLKFQALVIECAAEDQKKIRKRLESLLRTLEYAEKSMPKK
ncbi:BAG family molecular chaperone regulator 2-like [Branchiostoma lanceolatum]|uniref:BAG2 protein n=1 Tax=Branchiostoma lanceolatum TaxID=7740 RepID=A0A8J9ZK31_BRALA|nr:BAG2 [Branchiostoma lanceolatum]